MWSGASRSDWDRARGCEFGRGGQEEHEKCSLKSGGGRGRKDREERCERSYRTRTDLVGGGVVGIEVHGQGSHHQIDGEVVRPLGWAGFHPDRWSRLADAAAGI